MLTQEDIALCRKDFGFFAFQGMLRVFRIKLNLKREDGSKNYLWTLFNSINRLVFEKAYSPIVGIAIVAALAVGLVAYGITYAVSKPSYKLEETQTRAREVSAPTV